MQHSCSHYNAICNHSFRKRIELRTQEQPLVAKHIGGTIRDRNDRSRNRRTDEVPFLAGCSHFTRKNTRFRAPASSPTQSPCNIMQPFQCDLPPQLQETHRTTHTGTTTRCKTHRRNNSRQKRPQPQPPHRRGTFPRRLQSLYTELKGRITPHVTNFSRFRLGIEKQEGKRKYKSDGAVMVGEFVCVCMYVQVQ